MNINWSRIFSSVTKIKFSGGLVGRICMAVMVICLGLCVTGAVAVAFGGYGWIVALAAIVAVPAFSFPLLRHAIRYAEAHPGAAILEGANFIKHEQIIHESKNRPPTLAIVQEQVEELPSTPLSGEVLRELNEPDKEPVRLPPRSVERDDRNG